MLVISLNPLSSIVTALSPFCPFAAVVGEMDPGKGTSARDGSALAGALLEELDARGTSGVFATHLHEVFELPLLLPRTTEKRMRFERDPRSG